MLHEKYFKVMETFLADYSALVIGRDLAKKIPLSQKGISLALNELESKSILRSHRRGNQKVFSLNKDNSEVLDHIHLLELYRKIRFLETHRLIANILKADSRTVVVFGSYARGDERPDSDLDLLIIGQRKDNDYDSYAKPFDLEVSTKYVSEPEFKQQVIRKNPLFSEIVHSHIILSGFEVFVGALWRHYYGFD